MTNASENLNGVHVVVHETEPSARIYMFIDGLYTHWVEYDLEQLDRLIEVLNEKRIELTEKKDATH